MPRMPRSYIKTSFFHVLVQGINKNFIFNNPDDMKKYQDTLFMLKKEYNINLIAYCIMNNHVHLLLETDNINNLSSFMHRLNTIYALYYNKKYNRVGYVYRNRYKSEGIYSEEHLYNCISYIHNNPVKAGICKNPKKYMFSSCSNTNFENTYNDYSYYNFLEIDEDLDEKCKILIEDFFKNKNIKKEDLLNNKKLLKNLLIILKIDNCISFRKIERHLEISRETLRNLLK